MPTQKFYPKYFEKAVKASLGSNAFPSSGVLACSIFLYSATTYSASAETAPSGIVTNGWKTVNVTLTFDSVDSSLKFAVAKVEWLSTALPGQFRYAIICPGTTSTSYNNQPLMHIDFDSLITPNSGTKLAIEMSSTTPPEIDFS